MESPDVAAKHRKRRGYAHLNDLWLLLEVRVQMIIGLGTTQFIGKGSMSDIGPPLRDRVDIYKERIVTIKKHPRQLTHTHLA